MKGNVNRGQSDEGSRGPDDNERPPAERPYKPHLDGDDLKAHKPVKGGLKSPLNAALGDRMQPIDWYRDRVPEYLWWDALITMYELVPGGRRGRECLDAIRLHLPEDYVAIGVMSDFAAVPAEARGDLAPRLRALMGPAMELFGALISLYPDCPMSWVWPETTTDAYDVDSYLDYRLRALNARRDRPATDAQYAAIAELFYQRKIVLPVDADDLVETFLNYPKVENLSLAAGQIGSMSKAMMEMHEKNRAWVESFWRANRSRLPCYIRDEGGIEDQIRRQIDIANAAELPDTKRHAAGNLRLRLMRLVKEAIEAGIDPAMVDVIGGLGARATRVVEDIARGSHYRSGIWLHAGLRMVSEAVINGHHILDKGDDMAAAFRRYGQGQAKLIHRKAVDNYAKVADAEEAIKDGMERAIKGLHEAANEEGMDMMVDIRWDDWAGEPLRRRAKALGLDFQYDLFSLASDNIHGTWNMIRDSDLALCVNPAHGFHYLPARQMDRVAKDPVTVPLMLVEDLLKHAAQRWGVTIADPDQAPDEEE